MVLASEELWGHLGPLWSPACCSVLGLIILDLLWEPEHLFEQQKLLALIAASFHNL